MKIVCQKRVPEQYEHLSHYRFSGSTKSFFHWFERALKLISEWVSLKFPYREDAAVHRNNKLPTTGLS